MTIKGQMTAATFEFPAFEPHMKGPLTFSAILHIAFVIVAIVGLPYLTPELPVIDTSITVELVSAADMAKIDKPKEDVKRETPVQKEDEPPKPVVPKVDAKTPPKPVAPAPPETAEEEAPPEKEAVVKKLEPVKKPIPPKPVERPDQVKAEEQPEKFNAVLKNLIGSEAEPVKTETPGKADPSSAAMNAGELSALKAQLSQCWRLMAGARYAENLVVNVKVFVNPDRTVRDVKIEDLIRYNGDTFFRAAADSAKSAVYRCSPLDLPPNKYNEWNTIIISFDPRTML